jgi:hypothetical protein
MTGERRVRTVRAVSADGARTESADEEVDAFVAPFREQYAATLRASSAEDPARTVETAASRACPGPVSPPEDGEVTGVEVELQKVVVDP